eukprot:TRINITY_DN6953_c0_g2_i1.p1 TRINITY_DN6953_c0_g2~~TRINITY_DN6953_c0_g2_i1.p1  ORF type:complete len:227 (+),score=47.35 TRINITY_DN6953_c0_g2_i1:78-758(+)
MSVLRKTMVAPSSRRADLALWLSSCPPLPAVPCRFGGGSGGAMGKTAQWHYDVVAKGLAEFLEAAVHAVLRGREAYPASVYEAGQYLGAPCWVPRHALLRDYVRGEVHRVMELVRRGFVDAVGVVVRGARVDIGVRLMPFHEDRYAALDLAALARAFAARAAALAALEPAPGSAIPDAPAWHLEVAATRALPPSASWLFQTSSPARLDPTHTTAGDLPVTVEVTVD